MICHTKKKKKAIWLIAGNLSFHLLQIFRAIDLLPCYCLRRRRVSVCCDKNYSRNNDAVTGSIVPNQPDQNSRLRACETLTYAQFAQIEPVRSNKASFSLMVLWSNQEENCGGARPSHGGLQLPRGASTLPIRTWCCVMSYAARLAREERGCEDVRLIYRCQQISYVTKSVCANATELRFRCGSCLC